MQRPDSSTDSSRLRRRVGFSLLSVIACVACEDGGGVPPERQLPYRFEAAADLGSVPFFEDLDGDGLDEILHVLPPAAPLPGLRTAVLIRTQRPPDAHRLSYLGRVARPYALDLDQDGTREVFVPVLRGDTLHLSVADAEGTELLGFPLVVRRPELEPEGAPGWDPRVLGFHLLDVTGNRRRELVSVISTDSAGHPSGVFVHALPGGRLLGFLTVGAGLNQQSLKTLASGESVLVLAAEATAIGAGAVAGDPEDRHSYAMAVDLRLPLRVRWARELGGIGSRVWVRSIDLVGNRPEDLLIVATRGDRSRLTLLSTSAGVTLLAKNAPALSDPVVTDLEGDGQPELVAIEGGSSLVAFDQDLNVEERATLPIRVGHLREWPDLDADGRRELSAFDPDRERHVLLGGDLRVKAVLPDDGGGEPDQLEAVRRGPTRTPLLVAPAAYASQGFELAKNRWYLLWRLGPPAAGAAGPLLFFLLAAAWFRARQRYWLHKRVVRRLPAGDESASSSGVGPAERPLLRVEAVGQVEERRPPRRRKAGQDDGATERKRRPA